MLRRVISHTAGTILGGAVALATSMPAQAAEVDLNFGPLSIGDYCHANVSSSAFIGFYDSGGLRSGYFGHLLSERLADALGDVAEQSPDGQPDQHLPASRGGVG